MIKPIIVFDDKEERHEKRILDAKRKDVRHLIAFETDWFKYFDYNASTRELIINDEMDFNNIKCMFFHSSKDVPKFPEKTINQIKLKLTGITEVFRYSGTKDNIIQNGILNRDSFDLNLTRFADLFKNFNLPYFEVFSRNDSIVIENSKALIFKSLNKSLMNGSTWKDTINQEIVLRELNLIIYLTYSKFTSGSVIKNFETKSPELFIDFLNRNFI